LVAPTPAAQSTVQAMKAQIVPRLEANPLTASTYKPSSLTPKTALVSALGLFLAAAVALAQKMDALLVEYRQAAPVAHTTTTINTEGGAYIGGA